MVKIYMDGVFDLFHYGHVRAIKQCLDIVRKETANISDENPYEVIIGVISDKDTESYKRTPIFTLEERAEILGTINGVDKVIAPSPLIVTKEFIDTHGIDIVVHGFANDEDFEKQKEQHQELIDMGIFRQIRYTDTISTTDIINRIKDNY
jgi:cytidyltransferase-like protein